MIDDSITILVSTSHVPEHPLTTTIDETIASVRATLPSALIVIQCDGLASQHQTPTRMANYSGYKHALQGRYSNTVVLEYEESVNQAGMLGRALDYVKTPLIFYLEHDWAISPNVEWERLSRILLDGRANLIRLYWGCRIHPLHWGMMVDHVIWDERIPLFRTIQYSQNPHLATTAFYRMMYDEYLNNRTGAIEELMHGPCACGPWEKWKLCIYDPMDEGSTQMCRHLDGRKGER